MNVLLFLALLAQDARQIAITVDDLPCAGGCRDLAEMRSITARITNALRGTSAIGFVNEIGLQKDGERDARVRLLEQWLDAGLTLGNHTYEHLDPNTVPIDAYTDGIVQGEVVTRHLLEKRKLRMRYFRHPFTHTGPTAEYKRDLDKFLASRGYETAPFTLENSDYMWARVYRDAIERDDRRTAARVEKEYIEHLEAATRVAEQISMKMFQREIPQILLMHANLLNAAVMPELLRVFERRGYAFAALETALKDAAYRTPDLYVDRFGPSWFHRWGVALGIPYPSRDEPEPPAWVMSAYEAISKR
jgi:peptidoglycan/xylan/chitin deacetylase (PgdA/CDA1 family)